MAAMSCPSISVAAQPKLVQRSISGGSSLPHMVSSIALRPLLSTMATRLLRQYVAGGPHRLPALALVQLAVAQHAVDLYSRGPWTSAAKAMPLAYERPSPSAPVQPSRPGVSCMAGCPWRRLPRCLRVGSSSKGSTPSMARAAYWAGTEWPLLMIKRSRSGQAGFCGS